MDIRYMMSGVRGGAWIGDHTFQDITPSRSCLSLVGRDLRVELAMEERFVPVYLLCNNTQGIDFVVAVGCGAAAGSMWSKVGAG